MSDIHQRGAAIVVSTTSMVVVYGVISLFRFFIIIWIHTIYLAHSMSLPRGRGIERKMKASSSSSSFPSEPVPAQFIMNSMCPYAQKVWIALECSKTIYQLKEISLYGNNGKPDWFWKLNPAGTVPVVVCNDGCTVLPDSDQILNQYEIDYRKDANINEKLDYSISIKPLTEKSYRDVQEWRNLINNKLIPVGKKAVLSKSNQLQLFELLQEIDDKIGRSNTNNHDENDSSLLYLASTTTPTTADCHAFPFLWRLDQEFSFDNRNYRNIKSWLNLCSNQPEFATTIKNSWWWWW